MASTTNNTQAAPEKIIEAARACFSQFGVRKTAMEDIAREAGVSRGTVYRYFPDKETLFQAVSTEETVKFLDQMRHETSRLRSFSAKIERVVLLVDQFLHENPMNSAMARTDPDAFATALTTNARGLLALSVAEIEPMARAAVEAGELRAGLDTRRASEWVVRMVFSLVSTPSVTFDRDDPVQVRAFIHDFLVPGLA